MTYYLWTIFRWSTWRQHLPTPTTCHPLLPLLPLPTLFPVFISFSYFAWTLLQWLVMSNAFCQSADVLWSSQWNSELRLSTYFNAVQMLIARLETGVKDTYFRICRPPSRQDMNMYNRPSLFHRSDTRLHKLKTQVSFLIVFSVHFVSA